MWLKKRYQRNSSSFCKLNAAVPNVPPKTPCVALASWPPKNRDALPQVAPGTTPEPEGAALAQALGGRFLALPRADARMIQAAINAVQPIGKAA